MVELLERLLATIPVRNDLQVIVVDDCSTESIDALKAKYPSFAWYTTDFNGGAGKARNLGLEKAVGKWVLFADADDYFTEELNRMLDDYIGKDFDMVYFNVDIRDSNGRDCLKMSRFFKVREKILYKNDVERIRYRLTYPWAKLYSRRMIESNGLRFQESVISNDVMFSTQCDYYSSRIHIDTRLFYTHIKRANSVSENKTRGNLLIKYDIHCQRYSFLKTHGCRIDNLVDYLGEAMVQYARKKGGSKRTLFDISEKWGVKKSTMYCLYTHYIIRMYFVKFHRLWNSLL